MFKIFNKTKEVFLKYTGIKDNFQKFINETLQRFLNNYIDRTITLEDLQHIQELEYLPISVEKINNDALQDSPFILHKATIRKLKIPQLKDIKLTEKMSVKIQGVQIQIKKNTGLLRKDFSQQVRKDKEKLENFEEQNEQQEEQKFKIKGAFEDDSDEESLENQQQQQQQQQDHFKNFFKIFLSNIKLEVTDIQVSIYDEDPANNIQQDEKEKEKHYKNRQYNAMKKGKIPMPQYVLMLQIKKFEFSTQILQNCFEGYGYQINITDFSLHILHEEKQKQYLNILQLDQKNEMQMIELHSQTTILALESGVPLEINVQNEDKIQDFNIQMKIPKLEVIMDGFQLKILNLIINSFQEFQSKVLDIIIREQLEYEKQQNQKQQFAKTEITGFYNKKNNRKNKQQISDKNEEFQKDIQLKSNIKEIHHQIQDSIFSGNSNNKEKENDKKDGNQQKNEQNNENNDNQQIKQKKKLNNSQKEEEEERNNDDENHQEKVYNYQLKLENSKQQQNDENDKNDNLNNSNESNDKENDDEFQDDFQNNDYNNSNNQFEESDIFQSFADNGAFQKSGIFLNSLLQKSNKIIHPEQYKEGEQQLPDLSRQQSYISQKSQKVNNQQKSIMDSLSEDFFQSINNEEFFEQAQQDPDFKETVNMFAEKEDESIYENSILGNKGVNIKQKKAQINQILSKSILKDQKQRREELNQNQQQFQEILQQKEYKQGNLQIQLDIELITISIYSALNKDLDDELVYEKNNQQDEQKRQWQFQNEKGIKYNPSITSKMYLDIKIKQIYMYYELNNSTTVAAFKNMKISAVYKAKGPSFYDIKQSLENNNLNRITDHTCIQVIMRLNSKKLDQNHQMTKFCKQFTKYNFFGNIQNKNIFDEGIYCEEENEGKENSSKINKKEKQEVEPKPILKNYNNIQKQLENEKKSKGFFLKMEQQNEYEETQVNLVLEPIYFKISLPIVKDILQIIHPTSEYKEGLTNSNIFKQVQPDFSPNKDIQLKLQKSLSEQQKLKDWEKNIQNKKKELSKLGNTLKLQIFIKNTLICIDTQQQDLQQECNCFTLTNFQQKQKIQKKSSECNVSQDGFNNNMSNCSLSSSQDLSDCQQKQQQQNKNNFSDCLKTIRGFIIQINQLSILTIDSNQASVVWRQIDVGLYYLNRTLNLYQKKPLFHIYKMLSITNGFTDANPETQFQRSAVYNYVQVQLKQIELDQQITQFYNIQLSLQDINIEIEKQNYVILLQMIDDFQIGLESLQEVQKSLQQQIKIIEHSHKTLQFHRFNMLKNYLNKYKKKSSDEIDQNQDPQQESIQNQNNSQQFNNNFGDDSKSQIETESSIISDYYGEEIKIETLINIDISAYIDKVQTSVQCQKEFLQKDFAQQNDSDEEIQSDDDMCYLEKTLDTFILENYLLDPLKYKEFQLYKSVNTCKKKQDTTNLYFNKIFTTFSQNYDNQSLKLSKQASQASILNSNINNYQQQLENNIIQEGSVFVNEIVLEDTTQKFTFLGSNLIPKQTSKEQQNKLIYKKVKKTPLKSFYDLINNPNETIQDIVDINMVITRQFACENLLYPFLDSQYQKKLENQNNNKQNPNIYVINIKSIEKLYHNISECRKKLFNLVINFDFQKKERNINSQNTNNNSNSNNKKHHIHQSQNQSSQSLNNSEVHSEYDLSVKNHTLPQKIIDTKGNLDISLNHLGIRFNDFEFRFLANILDLSNTLIPEDLHKKQENDLENSEKNSPRSNNNFQEQSKNSNIEQVKSQLNQVQQKLQQQAQQQQFNYSKQHNVSPQKKQTILENASQVNSIYSSMANDDSQNNNKNNQQVTGSFIINLKAKIDNIHIDLFPCIQDQENNKILMNSRSVIELKELLIDVKNNKFQFASIKNINLKLLEYQDNSLRLNPVFLRNNIEIYGFTQILSLDNIFIDQKSQKFGVEIKDVDVKLCQDSINALSNHLTIVSILFENFTDYLNMQQCEKKQSNSDIKNNFMQHQDSFEGNKEEDSDDFIKFNNEQQNLFMKLKNPCKEILNRFHLSKLIGLFQIYNDFQQPNDKVIQKIQEFIKIQVDLKIEFIQASIYQGKDFDFKENQHIIDYNEDILDDYDEVECYSESDDENQDDNNAQDDEFKKSIKIEPNYNYFQRNSQNITNSNSHSNLIQKNTVKNLRQKKNGRNYQSYIKLQVSDVDIIFSDQQIPEIIYQDQSEKSIGSFNCSEEAQFKEINKDNCQNQKRITLSVKNLEILFKTQQQNTETIILQKSQQIQESQIIILDVVVHENYKLQNSQQINKNNNQSELHLDLNLDIADLQLHVLYNSDVKKFINSIFQENAEDSKNIEEIKDGLKKQNPKLQHEQEQILQSKNQSLLSSRQSQPVQQIQESQIKQEKQEKGTEIMLHNVFISNIKIVYQIDALLEAVIKNGNLEFDKYVYIDIGNQPTNIDGIQSFYSSKFQFKEFLLILTKLPGLRNILNLTNGLFNIFYYPYATIKYQNTGKTALGALFQGISELTKAIKQEGSNTIGMAGYIGKVIKKKLI